MEEETIWQRFLQPIFSLLIDENKLKSLSNGINWKQECDLLKDENLVYPDYYQSQNFHGIAGGYLTSSAAVTYDEITQYVLAPNETWIRQELINSVQGQPQKILDLGCGTGSSTILLKQAFPNAEVIGLDLSPFMLAIAKHKANRAGLKIKWLHGLAEKTNLLAERFDLVTASLLFHETPASISKAIIKEAYRLLTPGGQAIILDGNQESLRQTPWLTNVFEEPYIQEYAQGNLDGWLGVAGFEVIRTNPVWWMNQLSWGIKPILVERKNFQTISSLQDLEFVNLN